MAWFDLVTFAFQSTKISSTFALNTYERNIQVVDVLSTELPVLLDVLRKTLPEGVSLSGNLTVNTTFIFIDLVAWSQDYLLYFDSSQAWEGALRGKVHPRPFDKQVCLLTQFSDMAFATRRSKKTLLDLSLLYDHTESVDVSIPDTSTVAKRSWTKLKRPGQKPSPSKELRGRPSKKPRDFCRVAFISHPKILVIFTQHRENKIDGVNPIAGQASKTSAKWLRLLTIMSGLTSGCFSSDGRNFPVRTSTPVRKDLFSYL